MPVKEPKPALSDQEARALAKQIAKDSNKVRVKIAKTNGRNVLHVYVPGGRFPSGRGEEVGVTSLTISSLAEWYNHPAYQAAKFARKEARVAAEAGQKTADEDLKVSRKGS